MNGVGLFERNLDLFADRFPAVHHRLKAIASPLSTLVHDGGEVVDIDFGSGRLYNGDGRHSAREQAEAYVRSPGQIGYSLPQTNSFDSMISRRVHMRMLESLMRNQLGEMPLKAGGHTGFFFILGVGLGHHLPILLESIQTPYVVICEAFDEFLLASLRVLDWGELLETCERRGTEVHLICTGEAEAIASQADILVNRYGPVYLDGSYFFQHYPLWAYDEGKRRIINNMPRQMTALGYFEDERKMVRNVFANFQKCDFRLCTNEVRARNATPVFIIGSGPSLDQDMPYVTAWRDHAIVVSAGSGLQPCLKNGIIPDFHVELENSYPPYKKLQFIMETNAERFPKGVFEGIRLIASATVSPLIPPMFEDVSFFFRDAVTSSLTFGKGYDTRRGAAPTVVNTALAVLAYMGLGDIYLFGADCGWREGTSHHARDTIYYTSKFHLTEQMKGQFTLPGNFGGVIKTDQVFDWSRNMLEQVTRAFYLNVYNCSDGALITGATPRVAESLDFVGEPLDREAIIEQVMAGLPSFEAGEYFRSRPMTPYLEQLDRYQREVLTLLDNAVAKSWTFRTFHDRFWHDFVREPIFAELGMAALVHYSLVGIFKHSCIFMNRIADLDGRAQVTRDFYDIFRQSQDEMFSDARENLGQMAAWVETGAEPSWANGLPEFPGTSY